MLKQWVSSAAKIALTVGLFWFLLRKVDVAAAWEAGRGIVPAMFAASLALLIVQVMVCTVRWQLVLKAIGSHLPFWKACEIFWLGNFFGLVLPGAVGGDAIRMWKTRRAGLSLMASVNSVMLERVATVLGLILLVTATEPLLAEKMQGNAALWVFPALSVVAVGGIIFLTLLDRFPKSFHRWRVVVAFAKLAHDTRRLFLRPRNAVTVMGIVIFGHINLSLGVYVLAAGLNAPVSLLDCLVLVPPVILITTLPISIAGWGARELAMITILGFVGVPEHQALAISVLFGIVTTLTALPGGVFWLLSRDRKAIPEEGVETIQDQPL